MGRGGHDSVLSSFFCDAEQVVISSFPIRKKRSRNGSGSHVSSETSRHSPPTALKLGSEDSQLSGAYEYALQSFVVILDL